jgi:hypothetical protein
MSKINNINDFRKECKNTKNAESKKIHGKDVCFKIMDHLSSFGKFVNAYVYLEEIDASKDYQNNEPYVTYQNGKVLGIDTAHGFNESQSFDERYHSAESQITSVIEHFISMMHLCKGDKKMTPKLEEQLNELRLKLADQSL